MNTLDEVNYFCKLDKNDGALLINGKWGCGKTYFIQNIILKDNEISSKFIPIVISLFGINTNEQLHKEVKLAHLKAIHLMKGKKNTFSKKISSLWSPVKTILKEANKITGALVSIDWTVLYDIKPENGKSILLIFDDFERCSMNKDELLGAINHYIENDEIKIIIVANEEKISGDIDKSYSKLKEKVISHTLKLSADYLSITEDLIKQYENSNDYYSFLLENKQNISNVFEKSSTENIRSLKCALQGFKRIYDYIIPYISIKEVYTELMKYFLAITFEYKNDKIENIENNISARDGLSKKYNNINATYMLESIKKWICSGEWDVKLIKFEIQKLEKIYEKKNPKDIILNADMYYIDDDVLQNGYPLMIQDAYNGVLTLNEYISIIALLSILRANGFPQEIDYTLLKKGVETRINMLMKNETSEQQYYRNVISEDDKEINKEEKEIAKMIGNARDKLPYAMNRSKIIHALNNNDSNTVLSILEKYTGTFNQEYADAIIGYYRSVDNQEKGHFIEAFDRGLIIYKNYETTSLNETISGLNYLKVRINEYNPAGIISQILKKKFITTIDKAIENYKVHSL